MYLSLDLLNAFLFAFLRSRLSTLIAFGLIATVITACAPDEDSSSDSELNTLASWGISADNSGSTVYYTGFAYGDVEANSGSSVADIFTTSYSSSGNRNWIEQTGTALEDFPQAITVAASGNVYVAGYTEGELESGAWQGAADCFVIKYNASGTEQWVKQYGSVDNDYCWGIAADSSENLYVIGGTKSVFPDSGATNTKGDDLVLFKLNASGVRQWVKQLGRDGAISENTYSNTYGVAVDVDASNNVIIGGVTNDSIGGTALGDYDILLAAYDTSGSQTWIEQLGTAYGDYLRGLKVAASGNIYLTGYTYGTADPDYDYADYDEDADSTEVFLYKYSAAGSQQWVRQNGTSGEDRGYGLAIDSSENIFVTGATTGDLVGSNAGSYDIFILKYSSSGSLSWEVQNGSDVYDMATGVTTDSSDNVIVVGKTYGTFDSLSNSETAFTSFATQYDGSGNRQWTDLF